MKTIHGKYLIVKHLRNLADNIEQDKTDVIEINFTEHYNSYAREDCLFNHQYTGDSMIQIRLKDEARASLKVNAISVDKQMFKEKCQFCDKPAVISTQDVIRIDDPVFNPKPYKEFTGGTIRHFCEDHKPK